MDVRRERGDEDLSASQREDRAKRLADETLRARVPGTLGVRRVAEQEVDAAVPDLRRASPRPSSARRRACGRASSPPYGRRGPPRSR